MSKSVRPCLLLLASVAVSHAAQAQQIVGNRVSKEEGKIKLLNAAPIHIDGLPDVGEIVDSKPAEGYRGIWFTLGQKSEYGDKYSGGLGTYTANHVPLAVYAPAVRKTFFTYGGTPSAEKRQLQIMVGAFDHATGKVERPRVVIAKPGVNDPHDNACLQMDEQGYLYLFVSGRGNARPGEKFRSTRPYDFSQWKLIARETLTYPQAHFLPNQETLLLFTKYTGKGPQVGRELYWQTSSNNQAWSETGKLAGFGGHYQVSGRWKNKIASFFNYHPGGNVDQRTNLYYVQTTNGGKTWTTAAGKPLVLPLSDKKNEALVFNYEAQGKLMYTCDLNFDSAGNPVLLYVTSHSGLPGPKGDPREWVVARFDGKAWHEYVMTTSDHNYDMGSLWIEGDIWRIIAPTITGPQKWGAGGEMALWVSRDNGKNWKIERQLTRNSEFNHGYARRVSNGRDPFWTLWADGDPNQLSPSRLYFADSTGQHVFRLPATMEGDFATPVAFEP